MTTGKIRGIFRKILVFWPLLLPVIFLLQAPNGFPYPSHEAVYSDISISHYPNLVYLKRALTEYRMIPWWNPGIYSGTPTAGNPLVGLWYPGGWLALLFPLPLGINLAAGLHLLWGGIGMVLLLAESGIDKRGRIFGALGFMSAPKIMAHYGAGHLTLLYAVMWTPWLLWGAKWSEERGGRWVILPGVVIGLIIQADPRWIVYAGLLWVSWCLAQSHIGIQDTPGGAWVSNLIKVGIRLGLQSILGLLIASPLIIPMLELIKNSTRANLSPQEMVIFSLPPARILGLFYPDYGGNHEWTLYPGAVVMSLLLVSLFLKGKGKFEKFWLGVGWVALFLGLGSFLPGYEKLIQLPGFQYLRVPSRSLFLGTMAFPMVGAATIDRLMKDVRAQPPRQVVLGLTAVNSAVVALAGGAWILSADFPSSFVIGASLLLLSSIWIGRGLRAGKAGELWFLVLMSMALLDWGTFDLSVLDFHTRARVSGEQKEVAEYLDSQGGRIRVYSPSYSLPQQVAADHGLELADGVDPLVLKSYADFMSTATGVPTSGYSVTIPPFENGDPRKDNAAYRPDAGLLGLLNVGYVVSEFDLVEEGLEFKTQIGETRIYKNLDMRPRAWIQPGDKGVIDKFIPVDLLSWGPNQIEARVEGPGLLVLSEIRYPGWRVTVDGQVGEILEIAGILRGVLVTAGVHTVQFTMVPVSVYWGVGGLCLGAVLIIGYWLWCKRKGMW